MRHFPDMPLTVAARRAASAFRDDPSLGDLLFLEAWELGCAPGLGAMLCVRQIRRSNPALAAEVRAELIALRHLGQGPPAVAGIPAHSEHPIHS